MIDSIVEQIVSLERDNERLIADNFDLKSRLEKTDQATTRNRTTLQPTGI